jgi:hypothetical protein
MFMFFQFRTDLPSCRENLFHANFVENRGASLPVSVFDLAVFHIKRVPGYGGSINQLSCCRLIVLGYLDPDILEGVGDLTEEFMDRFEAIGKNLVNSIFDRVAVAEIGYPDFNPGLADSLDTSLSLLQPSRVPRKVNVDEGAEPLQVESLGGSVRPEKEAELSLTDPLFQVVAVASLEAAAPPKT